MRTKTLRAYLIIGCAVIAGAIWLVWYIWSPSPVAREFVTDMVPVEIYLQNTQGAGTRLRVPAAYMQWSAHRKGGLIDHTIALVVVYPEMVPVAKSGGDQGAEFSIHPLQFDSLVHIEAVAPQSIERIFADSVRESNRVPKADVPGFQVYRLHRAGQLKEYLTPLSRGDGTEPFAAVLDCGPYLDGDLTKKLWGICDAYVQPTDRLLIKYGVPRRAVDQLHEVGTKMEALIRGLIVDCFEGAKLADGDRPQHFHDCRY